MMDRRAPYLSPAEVGADEYMALSAIPSPPDCPPIEPREPSGRTTLRVVLSLFAVGIAACGLAFASSWWLR